MQGMYVQLAEVLSNIWLMVGIYLQTLFASHCYYGHTVTQICRMKTLAERESTGGGRSRPHLIRTKQKL